jgi:type I restriction enzyme, S subunit
MPQGRNLSGCQVFHSSDLPSEWDCAPLGDRIELAYGKALTEEDRKPGDADVYGSNGKVGVHNSALVNGSGILVGRKGSIGAVHYAPRPFWPIDTVYYVVQKAGDNLQFLYHILDHLQLARLNAATGVPGLSRRDVYALRGAFPPPHEQATIAQILDALDTALEHTCAAAARAREVKRALVQRIFSEGLRGERQKKTAIGLIPSSWDVMPVGSVVRTFQYGLSVSMEQKGGGTLSSARPPSKS